MAHLRDETRIGYGWMEDMVDVNFIKYGTSAVSHRRGNLV